MVQYIEYLFKTDLSIDQYVLRQTDKSFSLLDILKWYFCVDISMKTPNIIFRKWSFSNRCLLLSGITELFCYRTYGWSQQNNLEQTYAKECCQILLLVLSKSKQIDLFLFPLRSSENDMFFWIFQRGIKAN